MFGMGGTILLEGLERLLGISRSDASEDFLRLYWTDRGG